MGHWCARLPHGRRPGYAGSAGYNQNASPAGSSHPFDAAGRGSRQPGSAFKPIVRQRVRLRQADARQSPARYHHRVQRPRELGAADRQAARSVLVEAFQLAQHPGHPRSSASATRSTRRPGTGRNFTGGRTAFRGGWPVRSAGRGEADRPDLGLRTIANGVRVPPRMIEIFGPDGRSSIRRQIPSRKGARDLAAGRVPRDRHRPATRTRSRTRSGGQLAVYNGKGGSRRPVAVKTGTANDARDLATYGFLAPGAGDHPSLAVGLWMGNSDHSNPKSKEPAISLTAAAPLWHAFVRDYSNGWPVTSFSRPGGVVRAKIDAWTGGKPGPWTRDTTTEWFIAGTQPGARNRPRRPPHSQTCGSWQVDPPGPSWGRGFAGRRWTDRPVRLADRCPGAARGAGRSSVMCGQALGRARHGMTASRRKGRNHRHPHSRHRLRRGTSPGQRRLPCAAPARPSGHDASRQSDVSRQRRDRRQVDERRRVGRLDPVARSPPGSGTRRPDRISTSCSHSIARRPSVKIPQCGASHQPAV